MTNRHILQQKVEKNSNSEIYILNCYSSSDRTLHTTVFQLVSCVVCNSSTCVSEGIPGNVLVQMVFAEL